LNLVMSKPGRVYLLGGGILFASIMIDSAMVTRSIPAYVPKTFSWAGFGLNVPGPIVRFFACVII